MRTKSLAVVLYETRKIAIGQLIVSALIVLVYALLDKFNYTVVTGALIGSLAATGNMFFMALSLMKSYDKDTEVKAKQTAMISYFLRLIGLALVMVLAFKSRYFDGIAAVIPLLATRLIIYVSTLFEKKNDDISKNNDNGSENE